MLREIKNVRQEPGEGRRRWFESDGLELVVWLDARGRMTGFQLCYDSGRHEHALTWREGGGFSHDRVDPGEESPFKNLTPVLRPDGKVPWAEIRNRFSQRGGTLETDLRETIEARLAEGTKGRA